LHDTIDQELSSPLKDVLLPTSLIESVVEGIGLLLGPRLPESLLWLCRTHIRQDYYFFIQDLHTFLRLLNFLLRAKWPTSDGDKYVRIALFHINNVIISSLVIGVLLLRPDVPHLCRQLGIVWLLLQGALRVLRGSLIVAIPSSKFPLTGGPDTGYSLHDMISSGLHQVVHLLSRGLLLLVLRVIHLRAQPGALFGLLLEPVCVVLAGWLLGVEIPSAATGVGA
jgi:hypothetical protein